MSRMTLWSLLAVLAVGLVAGVLIGSYPTIAEAQDAPAADVAAITTPSPVVSAVPYQTRTEYEQDPFEASRLRRTTATVLRLVIVHADGSMEIKDAQ